MTYSLDSLWAAGNRLGQTDRGREALANLHRLLKGSLTGLDGMNKDAFTLLLSAALDTHPSTVRDICENCK